MRSLSEGALNSMNKRIYSFFISGHRSHNIRENRAKTNSRDIASDIIILLVILIWLYKPYKEIQPKSETPNKYGPLYDNGKEDEGSKEEGKNYPLDQLIYSEDHQGAYTNKSH